MGNAVGDRKHQTLDFDVTQTFQAYRWRACRRAIMLPLFGKVAGKLMPDQQVALDKVRGMWRFRTVELCDAGWWAMKSWKHVTYAMNCPPFGVRTNTRSRSCGRALVCPFCFARERVLFQFRKFEQTLFGISGPYMVGQQLWEAARKKPVTHGNPQLPLLRPDLKVVWFRRVIRDTKRSIPFNLGTVQEHVTAARDWVNTHRTGEFNRFGANRGTVQFNIYPLPRKGYVVTVRAGVLLVPKDMPDELTQEYVGVHGDGERENGPSAWAGVCPPTKGGLCEAFTQAIRYPQQLMRGLPTWTAATLNALHRFRATSWFGEKPDSKSTFKKSDFDTEDDEEEDDG